MSFNPLNTKIKQKKCRYCKEKFTPFNSLQPFCWESKCMEEHNKIEREKRARKAKRDFKKTDKPHITNTAQDTVNEYIRLRDKYKPCCSCGTFKDMQFHAGHYQNVGGHKQLRFYTLNIHKQCSVCNNWRSSNREQYRPFMVNKYGLGFVEKLESNQERGNYSIEYLERLIKVFRKKIKLYELKFRG